MNFRRGDVVLCKVPMPSTDMKEFKLRLGLIVSKQRNNERLQDVIIATCTSNVSRSRESTQYFIHGDEVGLAGIRVPSVVKCEALLSINKSSIIRILGRLSGEGISCVNNCLKDALELP
jgi:mRNA interferase MazF